VLAHPNTLAPLTTATGFVQIWRGERAGRHGPHTIQENYGFSGYFAR
jgi:hypothetical protein